MLEVISRALRREEVSLSDLEQLEGALSKLYGVELEKGCCAKDVAMAIVYCMAAEKGNWTFFDRMDFPEVDSEQDRDKKFPEEEMVDSVIALELEKEFCKFEDALGRIGSLSSRYVKLAAKLGEREEEKEVAPLDSHLHHVLNGDTVMEMKQRLECVEQELAFWKDVEAELPEEKGMRLIRLKNLDEALERNSDAISKIRQSWTSTKEQLPPNVFSKVLATEFRSEARRLAAEFPSSRFKSTPSNVHAKLKEMEESLDDNITLV